MVLCRSLQDLDSPYYYALSADNRLLRVNVAHVVGVLDGPEGEIDSQDAQKIQAAVQRVRPVDWANLSRELLRAHVGHACAGEGVHRARPPFTVDWASLLLL